MSEITNLFPSSEFENRWRGLVALGIYFALFKLLLHFATNGNYGYFRDELYFIACGEHLAWGYPDHAPMIAGVTKLSRVLFGNSLFAIRFFPALAGAIKVFLTALLVKEFGGRRFAVVLSCLCVIFAPVYLVGDTLLSMNAFEPVFWMMCAYAAVLAVKRENPRYWLWFGVFAGLGLMNKHSLIFFGFALVIGLLLTPARKYFFDKWLWFGGVIALLIFLPNIIWEQQHNWATLELLQNVRESGKNVELSPLEFIWQQIFQFLPTTAPIWLAGLWFFLANKNGKQFRFLGISYLVTLFLMILLKGKAYYLAPIYPMLFAAGATWWEQIFAVLRPPAQFLKYAYSAILVIAGIVVMPMVLPVLSIENFVRYQERLGIKPPKSEVAHEGVLPQHYGDQFGWEEMTAKVADVYYSLSPAERAKTGIYASNYGEAGAIDFFGGRYNLPKAISPHQSYFLWGPRDYSGEILIILGNARESAEKKCEVVEEKTLVNYPFSMADERYNIILCRQTKQPLGEMWSSLKHWN